MTSKEIRQSFLDFFASKQHAVLPGSPVALPADPTLLFVNAGMNQFKEVFLGVRKPACKRAVNSQKCIRVSGKHNDLEEVGRDTFHHTFFEMLGSWSFGDYGKKEAVSWAWELLTDVWKIDPHRLWATVYETDDEAFELWRKQPGMQPDHVLRFGEKENFWEMGETGPCGPCSEIHYDRTPEADARKEMVNAGLSEVIEIWNLVFIQHNRRADGSLEALAQQHVDTGMGFERICAVLQGKRSNYETDVFRPLIEKLASLSAHAYEAEHAASMRICADHIRALCIAVGDGVPPSNEGRGYVLRKLLRRAARCGRLLGLEKPFLCGLFPVLEEQLKAVFPELETHRERILRTLRAEEEAFLSTLERSTALFEAAASGLEEGGVFPGKEAFRLYDTFGVPFDLTVLMAEEKKLRVEESAFNKLMTAQRTRARSARCTGKKYADTDMTADLASQGVRSVFSGYERVSLETEVLAVLDSGAILLKETPFYPESGGQQGDQGEICGERFSFQVTGTQRPAEGIILHIGKPIRGTAQKGEWARAGIDRERRSQLQRSHTATHLLNQALRQIVDPSIKQAGSLVAADYLRFDFYCLEAVKPEQLLEIERLVGREIMKNTPVETTQMPLAAVRDSEDIQAVFEDKYGEIVRVVGIGGFSRELCGGTHVQMTGEIGPFRIVSESSAAAGIRRIEAVTGLEALKHSAQEHELLCGLSRRFSVKPVDLPARISTISGQLRAAEKQLKEAGMKAAASQADELAGRVEEVAGVPLLAADLGEMSMEALRQALDRLRGKISSAVIVAGSSYKGKAYLAASVSEECVQKGLHAGRLIERAAALIGGGGGGGPNRAQAGGRKAEKIAEAIAAVSGIVRDMKS